MQHLRVAKKRQVLLPRPLARKLGWRPGEVLIATARPRDIEIKPTPATPTHPDQLALGQRYQFTFPQQLAQQLRIVAGTQLRARTNGRRLLLQPIDPEVHLTRHAARELAHEFAALQRHQELIARRGPQVAGLDALTAVWKSQRKRRPRR